MYYRFGYRHYWFFESLHFLGGFFVASFFSNFFNSSVWILIGLSIVVFLWESAEVLVAKIPVSARYLRKTFKQKDAMPKLWDTVLDITLDFIGALIFIYFF